MEDAIKQAHGMANVRVLDSGSVEWGVFDEDGDCVAKGFAASKTVAAIEAGSHISRLLSARLESE